jgi:hypothetical protein
MRDGIMNHPDKPNTLSYIALKRLLYATILYGAMLVYFELLAVVGLPITNLLYDHQFIYITLVTSFVISLGLTFFWTLHMYTLGYTIKNQIGSFPTDFLQHMLAGTLLLLVFHLISIQFYLMPNYFWEPATSIYIRLLLWWLSTLLISIFLSAALTLLSNPDQN